MVPAATVLSHSAALMGIGSAQAGNGLPFDEVLDQWALRASATAASTIDRTAAASSPASQEGGSSRKRVRCSDGWRDGGNAYESGRRGDYPVFRRTSGATLEGCFDETSGSDLSSSGSFDFDTYQGSIAAPISALAARQATAVDPRGIKRSSTGV